VFGLDLVLLHAPSVWDFREEVILQGPGEQGIPVGVAQQLAALPEVAHADGLHLGQAKVGTSLTSVTTLPGGRALVLKQVEGDVTALAPGRMLVDQDEAARQALQIGSTVMVEMPRSAPRSYVVVGTYEANLLASKYLLDRSASVGFATAEDTVLLLSARPGVSSAALRSSVEAVTATLPSAELRNRKELADSATAQIDTTMAFINVLLLSVAIAVLGIVNTLALSVIDRPRELGLLRAIGLSRSHTRRMITSEAVIVAVFGALLGIAVGAGSASPFSRGCTTRASLSWQSPTAGCCCSWRRRASPG
jgi:putative ABC transport system permease protein